MNTHQKIVRIGGASGFWGDSSVGAPQLVASRQIDYLVFDYLAELTMSILAAARLKRPEMGYAVDFVSVAMRAVLRDVVAHNIRVVSNAGGVNPQGCADALAALAAELGVPLRIAVVTGDDVLPLIDELRQADPPIRDLAGGAPLPDKVLTANAYLGALPIKAALDAGAQVVITGRCVDSAVTLGILMHEHGWAEDALDPLAAGSLAGHILECGCQATGGLHTDWDRVPDWAHMGYPIVEVEASGDFVVTKPAGTGGLVVPAVVGEQMLYEIGDPAAYVLPDVVCDFTQVQLVQQAEHRVHVSGARGRAPTSTYKVSATYLEGFRTSAQLTIVGLQAAAKAQRTGEAIVQRTAELLLDNGWGDYSATHIEVLGAESCYGPHARAQQAREVILRLTATHSRKDALELLAREVAAAGTSFAPGTTGAGGRSGVSPSIRQYAFLLNKARVTPVVHMQGRSTEIVVPLGSNTPARRRSPCAPANAPKTQWPDCVEVPLVRLAWGRSGDKGDISNIGIIARSPQLLPVLREQLTEEAIASWLSHLVKGPVTRYDLPGIHAFNFVCENALGGGGMTTLRNDALGKGMAQIVLGMPISIPVHLLEQIGRGDPEKSP